ncbi:Holliday junction branch migration protein RuvA [Thermodesulfobacteriota bacterium]
MIAHLSGTLLRKSTQSIIIDNGGLGYEVFVPLSTFYTLPELDEEVSLHIHTHVKEDALTLFGFQAAIEKDVFLLLISVAGIGPKLGINILSGIGPDELLEAIAQGDALRLQAIPGIGKKTAARIALELKEKALLVKGDLQISPVHAIPDSGKRVFDDAVSALSNLGYPPKSAKRAVEKAFSTTDDQTLETLIKEALRRLS